MTERLKNSNNNEEIFYCFSLAVLQSLTVDHSKLWKILKEMGVPDHFTCVLRNLLSGQEAIVRGGHVTVDQFKTGNRVRQGYILSHCFYAEYIL